MDEKAGIHLNFISKSLRISRSSSDSSSNNSNINKNNNSENNSNNIDSNKIIQEKYNKYNIKDVNNIKNTSNNIDNHMESFFNNCSIGIKDRSINNNYSDFSSNIFKNNGDINNKVKTNINNLNENIRDATNKIKNKKINDNKNIIINDNYVNKRNLKKISVNINNLEDIPKNNVDNDNTTIEAVEDGKRFSFESKEIFSFGKTRNKIRVDSLSYSSNEREDLNMIKRSDSSSYSSSERENLNNSKNLKNPFLNEENPNDLKIEYEKEVEKKECPICREQFIADKKNKIKNCGHSFCNKCWYEFLSININENKLPSIKCLEYKCDSKLSDEFIFNLLNSNITLIKKYKKYKKESEVINNPNKKLCPFPNCDSFLELKDIEQKYVTCENNHIYCFICLKEPHEEKPCEEKMDKCIIEYATNKFVKKCPQCSIITEKNGGCNHITCSKCHYQWCWLCNEKYESDHYEQGKCKGFQFFKPKNEYEIKLMMEGKIDPDELSESQRQLDDDSFNFEIESIESNLNPFRNRRLDLNSNIVDILTSIPVKNEENNNNPAETLKIETIIFFIFSALFGYVFFNIRKYKLYNPYITLSNVKFLVIFFFQLIFINIIILMLTLIFMGFKGFIKTIENNYHPYTKEAILIFTNFIFGIFLFIIL